MKQQEHEGFLPPREVILSPFASGEKLDTPLDSRGLVDFEALVQTVNATVDPTYTWPPCPSRLNSKRNNLHHLQWPNAWYMNMDESLAFRKEFRELSISKAVLPIRFHNWVHIVTQPPPVPSKEVCQYRIEADRVMRKLFQCAQISAQLLRKDDLSKQSQKRLLRRLSAYDETLEEVRKLPEEFLQIQPDEFIVRTPEDIIPLASSLGRLASCHSISETTRIIRRTVAA